MSAPTQSLQVLPPSKLGFETGTADSGVHQKMLATATTRQAEEVKGAIFMAKQFPRDQLAAYQRIIRACERPGLAEAAVYVFPRGGSQVSGPSIRLAEVLAQNWGNLDFGFVELDQEPGKESIIMAYCWDLETNTRQTKVFTVPHVREKKSANGGNQVLTDPRDIYELCANQASRRVRSCILGIIPGDVIDDALRKCDETMANRDKAEGPLVERIKKLAGAFQKLGVTPQMMEMRIGKKSDVWTEFDYSTLKKIFLAIRDGFATKEQHFSYDATQEGKPAPEKGSPNFPPASGGGGSPGNEQQPERPNPAPPQNPRPPKPPRQPAPPAEKPQPPPPAPAPAPEAPPSDDLELPGAEDAPQPPPAPEAPEPPGDAEEAPLPVVVHLIKTTSGVDLSEVMRWLVENRVITRAPDSIAGLPKEALSLLVEKWGTVTSDIRGD